MTPILHLLFLAGISTVFSMLKLGIPVSIGAIIIIRKNKKKLLEETYTKGKTKMSTSIHPISFNLIYPDAIKNLNIKIKVSQYPLPELKWKNLDALVIDKNKIDLLDCRFNQFVHFFNEKEGNYYCLETESLNAHLWGTQAETQISSISSLFLLEQFKIYKNSFTHYAEFKKTFLRNL